MRSKITFTAIMEADADGTLHLPVPAEMRSAKIDVTVTMKPATGAITTLPKATPEMLQQRKDALAELRALGGLGDKIPDPAEWQKAIRKDRPLPGRD